jgi:hypothetical protein
MNGGRSVHVGGCHVGSIDGDHRNSILQWLSCHYIMELEWMYTYLFTCNMLISSEYACWISMEDVFHFITFHMVLLPLCRSLVSRFHGFVGLVTLIHDVKMSNNIHVLDILCGICVGCRNKVG